MKRFTLAELVFIVALFGVMFLFFFYVIITPREKARRINCTGNLIQISLAIRMYGQEHNNEFMNRPGRSGLEMLRAGGYLECAKMYACPSTRDNVDDGANLQASSVSYMYACGLNEATSVDSGLMREKDFNHRRYGNAGFVDGHVAGFAGREWWSSNNYFGSSCFSY